MPSVLITFRLGNSSTCFMLEALESVLGGAPKNIGGVSRILEKLGGVPRILVDINYSSLFCKLYVLFGYKTLD